MVATNVVMVDEAIIKSQRKNIEEAQIAYSNVPNCYT